MDRYIGLDVHAPSGTRAVIGPSGKRLGTQVVETNAGALIEVLRAIPKRRHLGMEEGTLSGWLHEVLEPHVDELQPTAGTPSSAAALANARSSVANGIPKRTATSR